VEQAFQVWAETKPKNQKALPITSVEQAFRPALMIKKFREL
jgi:hypothetical protein